MSTRAVVVGFVVVKKMTDARGRTREKVISRRYHARAAAEELARLAQAGGADAFVRSIIGVDDVGAL
jgi:hypothetical protein